MAMQNNDSLAAFGRYKTRPTTYSTFVPETEPTNDTPRTVAIFEQTWEWVTHTDSPTGRITWDDATETITINCYDTDQIADGDAANSKCRAELSRRPKCQDDGLVWYGYQFRVADYWPFPGATRWCIVSQVHQGGSVPGVKPGEPPFAVEFDMDNPNLLLKRNTNNPSSLGSNIQEVLATVPITPNTWHTFVAKLQFSAGGTSGTGNAKCWLDGGVVLDTESDGGWDGVLGYDYPAIGLAPKIGVYRKNEIGALVTVEYRNPEVQLDHGLLRDEYSSYS